MHKYGRLVLFIHNIALQIALLAFYVILSQ